MRVVIRNGRLVDPYQGIDGALDVLVEDGKVSGISPGLPTEDAITIDASDKIVCPGLIDMHVHFRQPGQHEYKETIRTGSRAAAKGGFTTVVCAPNTIPPIDNGKRVRQVLAIAKAESLVNLYTMACISKGMRGREVADVRQLVEQGAVATTDDGLPVADVNVMVEAAKENRRHGIPLCPHCEESRLRGRRQALVRRRFASEAKYIERDIHVARDTGCALHFQHVSLAASVSLIQRAKKEGLAVTAEATPHHSTLTGQEAQQIGPNAWVNPPLRTARDAEAIRAGLRNGTIDAIATDHAPHAPFEKLGGNPPLGVIGLETALAVVWTHLVHASVLSVSLAIEKMTANPARILNLRRGNLRVGMPADITIIDPNREWTVDASEFESKGRNCPFDGWKLRGKAVMTMVRGDVVMSEGTIMESPAQGLLQMQQLRLPM